jgi:hypothetical protein
MLITDSFIERLARAAEPLLDDHDPTDTGRMNAARAIVHAVLEAMRDGPSEAMLLASWNNTQKATPAERMAAELGASKDAHMLKMRRRWIAMIDAALSEAT